MGDALAQVRLAVKQAQDAMQELGDAERYIIYDALMSNWKIVTKQPAPSVSHWLVKSAGEVLAHMAMDSSRQYNYQPALVFSYSKEF